MKVDAKRSSGNHQILWWLATRNIVRVAMLTFTSVFANSHIFDKNASDNQMTAPALNERFCVLLSVHQFLHFFTMCIT